VGSAWCVIEARTEDPGRDEQPGDLPGSYNAPPIWPTIMWALLALGVLVALTLFAHRAN
jgi:hypothetical protein